MACENAAPRDYRACRTGGQARRGYPRRVAGVGDAVGPYRIEALPGEGGMGQVFRAAHAQTGDLVALKLLRPEFASDEGLIGRLLRAARTVEHRHLVGLLDAGEGEGEHYLAPELLRGDEPNAASDVYAFGCLVYACVAGRPPFGDRGLFAIGAGHLDEEPPDPCAAPPTRRRASRRPSASRCARRRPTARRRPRPMLDQLQWARAGVPVSVAPCPS